MKLQNKKLRILNAFNKQDLGVLTSSNLEIHTIVPPIKSLIRNMYYTLEKSRHGVGLAAPQVGVNVRMFIISGKDVGVPRMTVINPIILYYANDQYWQAEGCLSVPGVNVSVPRSKTIRVSYMDGAGTTHENIDMRGFLARIFQHEYDHLQGKLLIDLSKEDGPLI